MYPPWLDKTVTHANDPFFGVRWNIYLRDTIGLRTSMASIPQGVFK